MSEWGEQIIVDNTAAEALMMVSPAFRQVVLKKIADHEDILKGKMFAGICGHPEWKNACHCCGEVEIPVGAINCPKCEVKGMFFTVAGFPPPPMEAAD